METLSKLKVFIVDDDPFFRSMLERSLTNIGCTDIRLFNSGVECIDQLRPDTGLILLDYSMEIFDGIETLKKIKRINPNIPVVFISGQENISTAVNALKYGAFDYLIKAEVTEQILRAVVNKILLFKEMLEKKKMRKKVSQIFTGLTAGLFVVYSGRT